jgi:hypothetical protein
MAAIDPATEKSPEINQEIKKVAPLPVILQLTVLTKLLLGVSVILTQVLCESVFRKY